MITVADWKKTCTSLFELTRVACRAAGKFKDKLQLTWQTAEELNLNMLCSSASIPVDKARPEITKVLERLGLKSNQSAHL